VLVGGAHILGWVRSLVDITGWVGVGDGAEAAGMVGVGVKIRQVL
jgi:hypothetical protein